MTSISARDFNRDVSAAKRAAQDGPVYITDRGRPAFVLLLAEDYQRLTGRRTIIDWLRAEDDIEFEPEPVGTLPRPADL